MMIQLFHLLFLMIGFSSDQAQEYSNGDSFVVRGFRAVLLPESQSSRGSNFVKTHAGRIPHHPTSSNKRQAHRSRFLCRVVRELQGDGPCSQTGIVDRVHYCGWMGKLML